MPSGEKKFGTEALLALSAGLPVLVYADSGFGEALSEVEFGDSAFVDSEDTGVWAKEIKKIKETERKQRIDQAAVLSSDYDKKCNWEEQCIFLVGKMMEMVSGKKLIIQSAKYIQSTYEVLRHLSFFEGTLKMKKGGVCFFVQPSLAHSRAIKKSLKRISLEGVGHCNLKLAPLMYLEKDIQ